MSVNYFWDSLLQNAYSTATQSGNDLVKSIILKWLNYYILMAGCNSLNEMMVKQILN